MNTGGKKKLIPTYMQTSWKKKKKKKPEKMHRTV